MAHQSFTKTVLEAVVKIARDGNGEADTTATSKLLHLQTRKEHKKLLNTLSQLAKDGRLARIRQGYYAPVVNARPLDKREVMWNVMKMRRVVTIADLQEMADVSADYAKEWLRLLVKRGVAVKLVPQNKNNPHSWRLIQTDAAEMPVNSEKASYLRKLRQTRQQLGLKLDQIDESMKAVRSLIQTLGE